MAGAVGGEGVLVAVDRHLVGAAGRVVVLRGCAFEIGEGLVGLPFEPFADERGFVAGKRLGALEVVEHFEAVAAAFAVARERGEREGGHGVGIREAGFGQGFQLVEILRQALKGVGAAADAERVGDLVDVPKGTAAGKDHAEGHRGKEGEKFFHMLYFG